MNSNELYFARNLQISLIKIARKKFQRYLYLLILYIVRVELIQQGDAPW